MNIANQLPKNSFWAHRHIAVLVALDHISGKLSNWYLKVLCQRLFHFLIAGANADVEIACLQPPTLALEADMDHGVEMLDALSHKGSSRKNYEREGRCPHARYSET